MGSARGDVAQVETMEGAAFFAACKKNGVKAVQIRAISNYAIGQKKKEWKIEEALCKLKNLFVSYTP
jgi:nucleoside phosphorylase